jgi:hypothetical protein
VVSKRIMARKREGSGARRRREAGGEAVKRGVKLITTTRMAKGVKIKAGKVR